MRITWRSVGLVELGNVLGIFVCGCGDWFLLGFSFAPTAAPFFVYRRRLEFVVDLRDDAGCAARGPVNAGGTESVPDEDGGGDCANMLALEVAGIVGGVELVNKSKSILFVGSFERAEPARLGINRLTNVPAQLAHKIVGEAAGGKGRGVGAAVPIAMHLRADRSIASRNFSTG